MTLHNVAAKFLLSGPTSGVIKMNVGAAFVQAMLNPEEGTDSTLLSLTKPVGPSAFIPYRPLRKVCERKKLHSANWNEWFGFLTTEVQT